MTKGVKILLKYWLVLVIYQAIVLITLILYFFIMDSALSKTIFIGKLKTYIDNNKTAFEFIGVANPKDE